MQQMEQDDGSKPLCNAAATVDSNKIIREGSAEIVSGGNVFYNPVQEFNRDLSIAVLNVFAKLYAEQRNNGKCTNEAAPAQQLVREQKYENGLRILEALSATGLRSIRYAKEIAGVHSIMANDLSKKAVESIRTNVQHNGVTHLVETSHADAMTVMYMHTAPEQRFDVIDLDPYGCPNRFLDGAMQAIADGGLLLVTATDMAVLAGNAPEACFAKYNTVPLRMKCCHEMALRILLHCMEAHANRYGRFIEPMMSISADFYIRIFVRVHSSQAKCKYSMSKQSMIYQCTGCETFTLQPLGIVKPNPNAQNPQAVKFGIPTGPVVNAHCEHCNQKHHLGGPIWSAPLHNSSFVAQVLDAVRSDPLGQLGTQRRISGMLTVMQEELHDVPLYYVQDRLCGLLKLENMPTLKFRSAILHEGYRVSFSHACKNSIKTNAPAALLWDILRCWAAKHPVKQQHLEQNPVIKAILSKPSSKQYEFDELHAEANPTSRKNALTRFQANPTAYWGPGTRATIMSDNNKLDKRQRNQNKKQRARQQQNGNVEQTEQAAAVNVEDTAEVKSKVPKLT